MSPAIVAAQPKPSEGDRVLADEHQRLVKADYWHAYATGSMGRGVRFNNPYRLEHVLGDDARSLSLSALYADLSLGLGLGDAVGLSHGPTLALSIAVSGIRQEVMTPGYRVLYRPVSRWLFGARLGAPLVLEPDLGGGGELGLSAVCHVMGGLGPYAEVIGAAYLGAATHEVDMTVIPIVALQLGIWMDYEVLP